MEKQGNQSDCQKHIQVKVKVRFVKEKPFWGPGTDELMQGIRSRESVKEACEEMGLSYSKGRRMIRTAEAGWETPLVIRQQGGKHGGVSKITPEGELRMAFFQELERQVQAFAQEKYKELEAQFFKTANDIEKTLEKEAEG